MTRKGQAEGHAALEVEFADGTLAVTPLGATTKPVPKRPPPVKPGQGSLF